jgi:carboxymethylenebutenolidase
LCRWWKNFFEHIKDICRRFARLGYLAIAPDLFTRQGDPMTNVQDIIKQSGVEGSDEQVMSDPDATLEYVQAKKRPM